MSGKDSLMGKLLGNAGKFTDKQVAETLELLAENGARRGASDIHIEPHERFVLVRYRIDGALRGVHKLPRAALGAIMARLKTSAGLDPREIHMPQEGEYTIETANKIIDVRLITTPVYGGEKAVLHLSEQRGAPADLAKLGFWGDNLQTLKNIVASPYGLVMVTGPRHSGVVSTLFSLLKDLNSPLVSIATVEAAPKQRLPGVSQTFLTRGMAMTEALEASLRQDANIIMLDDVPDPQTAQAAVHASATGHMMLTGLRTNDSITALLRLRHSGVEPFLLATALRASIGQRLVRTLCPSCRQRYEVSPDERKHLEERLGINSPAARKRLHELEKSAAPAIFGDVKQLGSTASGITHLWQPHPTGCEDCDHTGYQGQTAITEVITNSETLQKAILSNNLVTAKAVQDATAKDNFIPMHIDGLIKSLRGQTSAAEVLRAIAYHA